MHTDIRKKSRRICMLLLAGLVLTAFLAPAVLPVQAETKKTAGKQTSAAATPTATPTPTPTPTAAPSVVSTNGIEGWPQAYDITSETGCLIDADTGAVLFSKNMDKQMYPASVTKILTCLLALENGKLDDKVTMTATGVAYVKTGSSNLATQVGEVFTLEQLLYGMMLKSANDMATQVGEYIGGGDLKTFVKMMNDKAASLGCTGSHFTNACGMPDEKHVTTAQDLALISAEALKNKDFRKIVGAHTYKIPATNKTAKARSLTSHDPLLVSPDYYYPGIIGGKTGYTDSALNTLVTFAERDGMTLIAVALKAKDGSETAKDNIRLLDYGFDNFTKVQVGRTAYTSSGGWLTLPKDADAAACTMKETSADTDDGTMVTDIYSFSGQIVGSNVMTKENAEKLAEVLKKEEEASQAAEASKAAAESRTLMDSRSAEENSAAAVSSASGKTDPASSAQGLAFSPAGWIAVGVLAVLILLGIGLIIGAVAAKKKAARSKKEDGSEKT